MVGFEPTRLAAPPPQDGEYTKFLHIRIKFLFLQFSLKIYEDF